MRSIKSLLVLCAAVLMTACAGLMKTEMDTGVFNQMAWQMSTIAHCYSSGQIDADTAASGRLMTQYQLSNYTYDEARLIQAARDIPSSYVLDRCKSTALDIASFRQRLAASQQQQAVPQYQYRQPSRTICNNIAGQILCSTY